MERDKEVLTKLQVDGYLVIRIWGNRIKKEFDSVVSEIENAIFERLKEVSG